MSELSPLFVVGAPLFLLGGLVCLVILGKVGGMAYGMQALTNLREFFASGPERAGLRRVFYVAAACAGLGAMLSFAGVAAQDAQRNRPCKQSCESAGHPEGRCRASPHQPYEPGDPYACWCRTGPSQWAEEPVELPGDPCAKR